MNLCCVRKGPKFIFLDLGLGLSGPFLVEQVQSSGFLEGFKRVQISVLVGELGFE